MRVLVLGGTGLIGSAVVRALVARGHAVLALARSDVSMARLRDIGAVPFAGDVTRLSWIAGLPMVDAVIHAACDVSTDMRAIDRDLVDVLLPALAARANRPRFIYTGGCWLFGATGDRVATEETPFDPLPAFAWMVPQLRRILADPEIQGIVIHPAMVYAASAAEGVFSRFARDAAERSAIRVVQSEEVRWPLVHREDLARLYVLALEGAPAGSSYIGSTSAGVTVGRIARAFARRFGTPNQQPQIVPADVVASELGEWARGYARDQQLSGQKARSELDWRPEHLDPEGDIAALPSRP
jgi:nucleoside-diphosphate-sugar epimerase